MVLATTILAGGGGPQGPRLLPTGGEHPFRPTMDAARARLLHCHFKIVNFLPRSVSQCSLNFLLPLKMLLTSGDDEGVRPTGGESRREGAGEPAGVVVAAEAAAAAARVTAI